MKKIYITFIALIFTITLFAQGIAVQGIARSNVNAAIVDTDLQFTFEIVSTTNTILFAETQQIRTDGFGVFSHIISTGSATVNTFNSVDFSLQGLRARVFIDLSGKTEVYDQPFQYTPYAHYAVKATDATNAVNAANGVPTGAIMPFMGTTAPAGWLFCDGDEIPTEHTALRALFSNNRTPNLRGRFLKGAGTGGGHNAIVGSQFDETILGQYQQQSMQDHRHSNGDFRTEADGAHSHRIPHRDSGTPASTDSGNGENEWGEQRSSDLGGSTYSKSTRNGDGSHSHNMRGTIGNAIQKSGAASTQPLFLSTEETKPNNFSVNYIIKL